MIGLIVGAGIALGASAIVGGILYSVVRRERARRRPR
jgi:hypothetical protein